MPSQDHLFAEILHSFAQLEHWIPGCGTWPVDLLFGKLPEADPADIYRLADAWGDLGQRLNNYYLDIATLANPVVHNWQGDGAAMAFNEAWLAHLQDTGNTTQMAFSMQQVTQGYGLNLETEEFFVAFALIQLLIEAIIAVINAFFSFGGSLSELPLAYAAARVAIKDAFDKALQAIMRLGEMLASGELKSVLARTTVKDLLGKLAKDVGKVGLDKMRTLPRAFWDGAKELGPRRMLARSAGDRAANQFRRDVLRNVMRKELSNQLREQAGESLAKRAEAWAALRALDKGGADLSRRVATEVEERLMQKWTGRAVGRELENLGEHEAFNVAERAGQHELANGTRDALDTFVREQVEKTGLLGAAGRHIGELSWAGVKFMGGAEVGAQTFEFLTGERTSFDPTEAAFAIGQGALMGGMMFGHGVLGKMGTGGLAGTATAAFSDAGQYVMGKVTHQDVNIDWSSDLEHGFADGVRMGLVFSGSNIGHGLVSHLVPHFGDRPGGEVFSLNDPNYGSNVFVVDREGGTLGYLSESGGAGYRFSDGSFVHIDPHADVAAPHDASGPAGPSSTALLDRPSTTTSGTSTGGGRPELTRGDTPSRPDSRVPGQRVPDTGGPARPDTSHPAASHPDTSQPGAGHPDTSQPGAGHQDTGAAHTDHQDPSAVTGHPDTTHSSGGHPDTTQAGSGHPDSTADHSASTTADHSASTTTDHSASTTADHSASTTADHSASTTADHSASTTTDHTSPSGHDPAAGHSGDDPGAPPGHSITDGPAASDHPVDTDHSTDTTDHTTDTTDRTADTTDRTTTDGRTDKRTDDGSGDPAVAHPEHDQSGPVAPAPRTELPADRIAVREPPSTVDTGAGRSHGEQVRAATQDRHAPAALREQHEAHLGPTGAGHPAHSAERIDRVVDDLALTGRDAVNAAHSAPLGHDDPAASRPGHDGALPEDGIRWVEAAGAAPGVRDEVTALLFRDVLELRVPGGLAEGEPHVIRAQAHDLAEQILANPRESVSSVDSVKRLREYVRTEFSRTDASGRERVDRTATDRVADEAARQAREPEHRPPTEHERTDHDGTQHDGTQHDGTQHDTTQQHERPEHQSTQHDPTQHDPTQHDPTQHHPTQHDAPVAGHEPVHPRIVGEPRPESTRFQRHFMELREVGRTPDGEPIRHWVRVTETVEQHWTEAEYRVDNLEGGLAGPQAHEAAHRAAQDLADREYRRMVEATDKWADGTGQIDEIARVGGMSAATVLHDGRIIASTSVRTRTPRVHQDTGLTDHEWQRLNNEERTRVAAGAARSAKMARRADATRDLPDSVHPLVREALDGVPENLRSTTHGKCAEPAVLSAVARAVEADYRAEIAQHGGHEPGSDAFKEQLRQRFEAALKDRQIASHRVSGEPMERSEQFPCSTDDQLIDHFGMHSDYVDQAIAQAHIDPQRGVVVLAGPGDLRDVAMHLPDLGPDHLVVVLHGEASATSITAHIGDREAGGVELARVLDRIVADHPELADRKIVLVTCEAGAIGPGIGGRDTSLAAQVAERTHATVVAPRTRVAVSDHGDVIAVEESPHGLTDPEHNPVGTSWVEVQPDGQVRELRSDELPFRSNPDGPTGRQVYAGGAEHQQPGYGYSHEANAIYGTRFVPDGGVGRLMEHELLEVGADTDVRDFGGRVTSIERQGFQLRVVDDHGQEHHFTVEVGEGMRNVAGTTLHAGTVADPHVVTVSGGAHGDILPRVWLHEITETLDEQAMWAQQPHEAGLLGRLSGVIGAGHDAGAHPSAPHDGPPGGPRVSQSHINARLAERNFLVRQLHDPAQRWQHEQVRTDIGGLDRELHDAGYDTSGLERVEAPRTPEHDPHNELWQQRPWHAEGRRPSMDELIPSTNAEAHHWSGAMRDELAGLLEGRDFGGVHVRMAETDPVVASRDHLLVRVEIIDGNSRVGSMGFTLTRTPEGRLSVSHDTVGISEHSRGHGFYRAFNEHLEGWYRESGVDSVRLRAASDTGGYVHAREGTDWDPHAEHDAREVFGRLHNQLGKLVNDDAAIVRAMHGDPNVDLNQLLRDYRASTPEHARAEIQRQYHEGVDVYERARHTQFGSRDFPTPREVADAGRPPADQAGRDETWVGKRTLLGADWHGEKHISDTGPLHTRAEHALTQHDATHDPTAQHATAQHATAQHAAPAHDPVPVAEAPRPEALMPEPERVFHELRARGDEIAAEQLRFAEQLRGDGKYWFTKVYHHVTVKELAAIDAGVYRYPTMKLQEVAAFHEAWKVNIEAWMAGDHDRVEPHWREAFAAAEATNTGHYPLPSLRILAAIQPSLEAHIRFDLPRAIVYALDRFYGDTGIGQSEFGHDFDRMGPVFDEAAAALRPEISEHTFFADPGQYGLAQRIGQEFLLKVPTTREHTWQKVDWIIRLREADITEPFRMHAYLKHQSQISFGHSGAHDYRIGGREIENFHWLDQPEPELPAAHQQLPDPGQVTAASVPGSAQFHGFARPEADPHAVGQLAHEALDRALDERPLPVHVEITTASPHQPDWPGDAVARSVPVDAHGNDLPHGSVPPPDGGWRIEVSDRALDIAVPRAVAHEVAELDEIQARAAIGEPTSVPDFLHRGDTPPGARLSPHDVGRLAERGVLREQAGDHRLTPEERAGARAELANLDGELGLTGHDAATAGRRDLVAQFEHERSSLPSGHFEGDRPPFGFEHVYADPAYHGLAVRAEQALGRWYFHDATTVDTVRLAVVRLRDVLTTLTEAAHPGESREQIAQRVESVFFQEGAEDSAGQVGTGVRLDELIEHGNLRELMTSFYNAAYVNRDNPGTLSHRINDVLDHDRFDAAREAGMNMDELRAVQHQLDENPARRVAAMVQPFQFARDTFGTGNVVSMSRHPLRDLGEMTASQRRHPRDEDDALAQGLIHTPADYERLGAPLGRFEEAYLQRVVEGGLTPDTLLPWREGLTAHETTGSIWARRVTERGLVAVDGVSGTTARMLTAAKLIGLDPAQAEHFLGGLMGWMLPGRDHSLFEIVRGAQIARVLPESRPDAPELYRRAPAISTEALRGEALPGGLAPHETLYHQHAVDPDGFSETQHKVQEIADRLAPQLRTGEVTDHDLAQWLERNGIDPSDPAAVRALGEHLTEPHVMALAVYTRHSHYLINNVIRTEMFTHSDLAVRANFTHKVDQLIDHYLEKLAQGERPLPLPLKLRPLLHDDAGHLTSESPLSPHARDWVQARRTQLAEQRTAQELRDSRRILDAVEADLRAVDAARLADAARAEITAQARVVGPELLAEVRWHADMVHDALHQLPTVGSREEPVLAYRGDWLTPVHSPIYGSALHPHGTAREVLSMSRRLDVAVRFMGENPAAGRKVLVVFELTGEQARDISVFSSFASDQEMVFPPGSELHRVRSSALADQVRQQLPEEWRDQCDIVVMREAPSTPPVDQHIHWGGAGYVDNPQDPVTGAAYDMIRASTTDVAAIATHTGLDPHILEQVKEHLFRTEHEVPLGPGSVVRGYFAPMEHIAHLWTAAMDGHLSEADAVRLRRLIAHEYVESELMRAGAPYRSADPAAWDEDGVYFATPQHFGAHDLAPIEGNHLPPLKLWERYGIPVPEGFTLDGDLSQLREAAANAVDWYRARGTSAR